MSFIINFFLDRKFGEEEKTFKYDNYFTIQKDIFSIVNEEYEKDEEIYIRNKGLDLTFVYGGAFNKKHKSLEIYIHKDPYYKGNDRGSVKDSLLLVDEFIENNYKEFYEKINKIIYGTDNSKNKKVKYRTSNILNKDYIMVIKINDAVVSDEEIEKIINCIEAHHGAVPYKSIEAEIVANADCYIFIHPRGVFAYKSLLEKRGIAFNEQFRQLNFKLQEKYKLLSLEEVKNELDKYYLIFADLYESILGKEK